MKRKLLFICSLILTLCLCLFPTACFGETADVSINPSVVSINIERDEEDQPYAVIISIKDVELDENTTLLAVMEDMKDEQSFTYKVESGMVTEICGRANGINSYWMLYTSDAELSNSVWGTYEYSGQALGSAILGAEALTVISGGVYIWSYQAF